MQMFYCFFVLQKICKFVALKSNVMGKEKSVKKEAKKAPAKSQKEKKEAKKLKKLAKGS